MAVDKATALPKFMPYLAVLGSALALTSCGGGSDNGMPIQQRIDAATSTANNNSACTSLTPFYWEIGSAGGQLASGAAGASPPAPTTVMLIASASKWVFSTYVVEKQGGTLSASDIKFMNFESGYTNFNACTVSASTTVASCLGETGTDGIHTNGYQFAATTGKFFYNGGHMQTLANNIGLGPDDYAALATDIQSVVGSDVAITYPFDPQLAGGGRTTPAYYAQFLRNMLSGQYSHMLYLLGSNAVCTHTHSSECPTALYSPVNESSPGSASNDVTDEAWHYSLGHWVEDDPAVGDGAFSSAGAFGFYPWIDKNKTYYGILAREDLAHASAGVSSALCGRLIRKAWLLGQAQ